LVFILNFLLYFNNISKYSIITINKYYNILKKIKEDKFKKIITYFYIINKYLLKPQKNINVICILQDLLHFKF